jgi:hypothetical protein
VNKYDYNCCHQGEYVKLTEDALGQNRQIADIVAGDKAEHTGRAYDIGQCSSRNQKKNGKKSDDPDQELLPAINSTLSHYQSNKYYSNLKRL